MAGKIVQFKVEVNNLEDINLFKKQFRYEIVERGYDQPLADSIPELKRRLKFLINEQIRHIETTAPPEPTEKTNNLEQQVINVPRSDKEIIKQLTGVDVRNHDNTKDYSTLTGPKFIVSHASRGQDLSNRVTVRVPIYPNDTTSSHYAQVREFFRSAVIGIPSETGEMEYFQNKGEDLIDYIKLKCSPDIGWSSDKTRHRFELDSKKNRKDSNTPYAEWTLSQEAVEKIRAEELKFRKLNPIMDNVKEGEYEAARDYLRRTEQDDVAQEMDAQIEQMEKGDDLEPSVEAYRNIIGLINSLKISKDIKPAIVTYKLISDFGAVGPEEQDFYDHIIREIRLWVMEMGDVWFNKVVKAVENLIEKFESKY